jgi:hypothetical protein
MTRHGARPKVRCAIYTRKSSEEGLELSFNSLGAQHEACAAYIDSQRHEGWVALDDRYDDGGYSGGTLERPALQRLIRDIETGRVGTVAATRSIGGAGDRGPPRDGPELRRCSQLEIWTTLVLKTRLRWRRGSGFPCRRPCLSGARRRSADPRSPD